MPKQPKLLKQSPVTQSNRVAPKMPRAFRKRRAVASFGLANAAIIIIFSGSESGGRVTFHVEV